MEEGAGEQRLRGSPNSPASKREGTRQPRALLLHCSHPLPWVLLDTGLMAPASGSDVAGLGLPTPQLRDLDCSVL